MKEMEIADRMGLYGETAMTYRFIMLANLVQAMLSGDETSSKKLTQQANELMQELLK